MRTQSKHIGTHWYTVVATRLSGIIQYRGIKWAAGPSTAGLGMVELGEAGQGVAPPLHIVPRQGMQTQDGQSRREEKAG